MGDRLSRATEYGILNILITDDLFHLAHGM